MSWTRLDRGRRIACRDMPWEECNTNENIVGKESLMKTFAGRAIPAIVVAMLLFLAGCGEKTCHFVAPDAGGLEPGAPVEWYNATIGSVTGVQTDGTGVRVDIVFDAAHAKSVHDGVVALIESNPVRVPKPIVVLRDGRDESRPVLGNGVRIPFVVPGNAVQESTSSFVEWLKASRTEELDLVKVGLGVLATFLGLVALFFRRITAFVKRLLWLAVLAIAVYLAWWIRTDWQSHQERFDDLKAKSQEALDWLSQNGEKVKAIVEPLASQDDE